MKLETIPLIMGVIIAIIGLGLIIDARVADRAPGRERRRRLRLERNRRGELLIGIGVLFMAAAVLGRDTWKYSILAILLGALLLGIGAWMNRSYLRELIFNRGAARRRPEGLQDRPAPGVTGRDQPASQEPPAGP